MDCGVPIRNSSWLGTGYGNRDIRKSLLHHDMAATLTNFFEPMPRKNSANLFPGEDTKLTQWQPPLGLQILPHESVPEFLRMKLFQKITQVPPGDSCEPLLLYLLG